MNFSWPGPTVARAFMAGLITLIGAGKALAALGGVPSALSELGPSPDTAVVKMSAPKPTTPSSRYSQNTLYLATGTAVQEFFSPSGQVFAVTWRGPVLPDLPVLLGEYFGQLKAQVEQERLAGRRGAPVRVVRDDLVLSSSGRMRNFYGHAYVPALVPSGVEINNVLR